MTKSSVKINQTWSELQGVKKKKNTVLKHKKKMYKVDFSVTTKIIPCILLLKKNEPTKDKQEKIIHVYYRILCFQIYGLEHL